MTYRVEVVVGLPLLHLHDRRGDDQPRAVAQLVGHREHVLVRVAGEVSSCARVIIVSLGAFLEGHEAVQLLLFGVGLGAAALARAHDDRRQPPAGLVLLSLLVLLDLAQSVQEEELRLPVVREVFGHVDREEHLDGDVEAQAGERRAPVDGDVRADDVNQEEEAERPRDERVVDLNQEHGTWSMGA